MKTSNAVFAAVIVLGAAVLPACGPSKSTRSVYFYLTSAAKKNIKTLKFIVTPTTGDFAGGDGECVFGAAAGGDVPLNTTVVGAGGELTVTKGETASLLGPGAVVVTCQITDDGAAPSFILDTTTCTRASGAVDPDVDCALTFTLSATVECGDGVIGGSEACDDGDANADNAPCLSDCSLAECGDEEVCDDEACETGPGGDVEECDDGNTVDNDDCANDCSEN
jgi:hypothetical protein